MDSIWLLRALPRSRGSFGDGERKICSSVPFVLSCLTEMLSSKRGLEESSRRSPPQLTERAKSGGRAWALGMKGLVARTMSRTIRMEAAKDPTSSKG